MQERFRSSASWDENSVLERFVNPTVCCCFFAIEIAALVGCFRIFQKFLTRLLGMGWEFGGGVFGIDFHCGFCFDFCLSFGCDFDFVKDPVIDFDSWSAREV